MTPDVLADADEAAARAAEAAGVVVRELETLDELDAAIAAVRRDLGRRGAATPPLRPDMLRAMTKAGNYASGAYDAASGELLGACIGFFGPPRRAELHSHIAGSCPAGLGRAVGFALKVHQRAWCLRRDVRVDRLDLRPADQAERVLQPGQAGRPPGGVPAELLRRDGRRDQRRGRDRPDAGALGPAVPGRRARRAPGSPGGRRLSAERLARRGGGPVRRARRLARRRATAARDAAAGARRRPRRHRGDAAGRARARRRRGGPRCATCWRRSGRRGARDGL